MQETGDRIGGTVERARAPARCFQDLIVWQKAHHFVLDVYKLTERFPKTEMYGLASQLRRAAVSVPANIAEGFRKKGRPDKSRFLNIAQGSLEEARYYLILARDLEYGDPTEVMTKAEEVSKLLEAYARSILSSDS
ncbi:MAG: four helix bundle protein [Phycisphaerae bacterium]|nr:four helix bundle protein [Phycisphaerae bacterium]